MTDRAPLRKPVARAVRRKLVLLMACAVAVAVGCTTGVAETVRPPPAHSPGPAATATVAVAEAASTPNSNPRTTTVPTTTPFAPTFPAGVAAPPTPVPTTGAAATRTPAVSTAMPRPEAPAVVPTTPPALASTPIPSPSSTPAPAAAQPSNPTSNPTSTPTSEARRHSCDEAHSMRSVEGSTASELVIVNGSRDAAEVFWIDYSGQRNLWSTVPAGASVTVQTFLTHPWLVSGADGCIGVYMPPARVVIDLTPRPEDAPLASDARAGRSFEDRPDEASGPQIHLIYVLPSDGKDRELDINGTIESTLAVAQRWLAKQTGGRSFRVDTFEDKPDISFFRGPDTDSAMQRNGAFVRDVLESRLRVTGRFSRADKIYVAYYDGGSTHACGGAFWPHDLPGSLVALYLRADLGKPGFRCGPEGLQSGASEPGYWEFAFLHEVLHGLGYVAPCGASHHRRGHSSDDPTDLMYAGEQPWNPTRLDPGNDDFYKHSISGCPDFADSPYLTAAKS